jgi:hypothetical protein
MSDELAVIKSKTKRDIFKFGGENPSAINLEHVSMMKLEGKKLMFNFHNSGITVDFETIDGAKNAFEQIINIWAADVVE